VIDSERALREYAAEFRYPPTPDVSTAVVARLEAGQARRRRGALALVLAATLTSVALGLAVAPARTAILRLFGFDGATVVRIGELPPISRPVKIERGPRVTRARAIGAATFPILALPGQAPNALYFVDDQVTLVYGRVSRPRLVLTEWHPCCGQEVLLKGVPLGTPLERVTVDGACGAWIAGPHVVRAGGETRIAREALLWQRRGVLYRIEARLTKEQALLLARSLEPLTRQSN